MEGMLERLLSDDEAQGGADDDRNEALTQWRQAFESQGNKSRGTSGHGHTTPVGAGADGMASYQHVAQNLPLSLRAQFVDPIDAGLVTRDEMDAAFEQ